MGLWGSQVQILSFRLSFGAKEKEQDYIPNQTSLINIITFIGCFIGYEIVKRINWLRPMLGMKKI